MARGRIIANDITKGKRVVRPTGVSGFGGYVGSSYARSHRIDRHGVPDRPVANPPGAAWRHQTRQNLLRVSMFARRWLVTEGFGQTKSRCGKQNSAKNMWHN